MKISHNIKKYARLLKESIIDNLDYAEYLHFRKWKPVDEYPINPINVSVFKLPDNSKLSINSSFVFNENHKKILNISLNLTHEVRGFCLEENALRVLKIPKEKVSLKIPFSYEINYENIVTNLFNSYEQLEKGEEAQ